jgi:hypothetical protein
MTRSLVRRVAVLFVLTLLVATPWSHAAPRQERGAAPATSLSQLWTRLTSLWGDIGCIMDPNGRCHDSAASQGDIGCIADPGGRCRTPAPSQGDIGCGADPGGRCHTSVTSDIGCGADPNGCGQ